MSNIYQHRSLVPISASSSSSGINNSSTNGNSAVTNSHSTAQTSGSPPPPPSGMNERDRERDRASTLSGGPTNAAGTSSQIKSDPNGPPPLVVSKNGGGVASTALPIPSSVTAPTGPGGGPPNGPPLPVGVHPAAVAAQQQHAAAQAQAQAHHHHAAQQQHHHHAVQAQAAAQAQAQAMAANHSSRLADLLDFVKHEFDMMGGEAAQMKGQRDEYEHMSEFCELNSRISRWGYQVGATRGEGGDLPVPVGRARVGWGGRRGIDVCLTISKRKTKTGTDNMTSSPRQSRIKWARCNGCNSTSWSSRSDIAPWHLSELCSGGFLTCVTESDLRVCC